MLYVPMPELSTAVLPKVRPLTTLAVSPLRNPVMLPVNVGFARPYSRVALSAVTVSRARVMVRVPGT